MKLLLIQTLTDSPEGPIYPIGLSSIAAVLPKHIEVRGFDMNIYKDPYGDMAKAIAEFKPDVVGVSFRNIKVFRPGKHEPTSVELRRMVKAIYDCVGPTVPIIAGGTAFSLYAQQMMEIVPEFTFGICGEGEIAFVKALEQYPGSLKGIPGVMYRDGSQIISQGNGEQPSVPDLPWPRRDLFPMAAYRDFRTSVGVMTKRGCPFRCAHCSDIYLIGGRVRARRPEDIVAELKYLRDEHGVYQFMFSDQEFNVPGKYIKTVLQAMIDAKLGLKWTAYFNPVGLDEELITMFRDAGTDMIGLSPDICDDRMLASLHKGYKMKHLHKANELVKKLNMPIEYNFLLGLPGQTIWSLIKTLWFVVATKIKLGKLFRLHGLFVVPARIYPHTPVAKAALEAGYIKSERELIDPVFSKATIDKSMGRIEGFLTQRAERAITSLVYVLWKAKRLFKPKPAAHS